MVLPKHFGQKIAPNSARMVLRGGSRQKIAPNPARKVLRGGSRQKIASNPARMVLRGGSRQKKASFPARNGNATACRLPPAVTFPVYCKNPGSGTPKDKDNHLVCKNCRYFLFLRPKNKERRQRVIEVLMGRGCGT